MTRPIPQTGRHWLVTGGAGLLGHVLCGHLVAQGARVTAVCRDHAPDVADVTRLDLDLTDLDALRAALDAARPDVIVHAAGITNVDACESDEAHADRLHADTAGACAAWAKANGARAVYISTDHLWTGDVPMVDEDTPPHPLNAYARSKLAGERRTLEADPDALVLRTNFFGPGRPWRRSLSDWVIDSLAQGKSINGFNDVFFTPIASPLLADLIIEMVQRGARGIYHLAGGERISKYDFARRLAVAMGADPALVHSAPMISAHLAAPRPNDMSLSTAKAAAFLGRALPNLDESLAALPGLPAPATLATPVPARRIGYGKQSIDADDEAAVLGVLRSDYLTQGPAVPRFEDALAEMVGARHAIAVSSGTAALHIACLAAGLAPGERGVTQALTFVASANGMRYCGAESDLLDVGADDLTLVPEQVEAYLRRHPDTRVVMPVHFGGLAGRSAELRAAAGDRVVIEDASHALGGHYADGGAVGCGAHADMTVFSFHPVKPVTTAEGGAVVTNDDRLAKLLRMLRNHGIEREADGWEDRDAAFEDGEALPWYYEQQLLGFNYRMNDLQAALGLAQLSKLPRFLNRRREIAARYDALFADLPGVSLVQNQPEQRARSGHHLYVLRFDFDALGLTRRQLMGRLSEAGIGTQVHYIPVYRQPYFRRHGAPAPSAFPVIESYYDEALSIPFYPELTDETVDRVAAAVRAAVTDGKGSGKG